MHPSQENEIETISLVPAPGAVFKGSFATTQRTGAYADHCLVSPRQQAVVPFLISGWNDPAIYKSAFIEMISTMLFCYTSGLTDVTFGQYGIYVPNWVGITNIIRLTIFIFATAPASGGHINPLITFATLLTGLTPLPRAVLYMIGQLLGSAVAGGLLRGSFDKSTLVTKYHGGGCFFDHDATTTVTRGQAFVIEMMSSCTLLFLAFGCALDPRQAAVFGPVLSPFLVAVSLGLCSFASSGLSPGYAGAGMNPARCFAFGVSRGSFQDQWIWWFGPAAGAVLAAAVYRAVPPYHAKKVEILPVETRESVPKRIGDHQSPPP